MNNYNLKTLACVWALAVFACVDAGAQVTTIFNNASSYNTNSLAVVNGVAYGTELTVTPGSQATFNSIGIEYFAPVLSSTDVGIDVRFYINNGYAVNSYASPGSLFFDSGWYYGLASGANTITYTTDDFSAPGAWNSSVVPAYLIPGVFTMVVTFTNLGTFDWMTLPLANTTTGVVTSHGDYWVYSDGTWQLDYLTNGVAANFLMDITATPEPSTFGLAFVGGALLLGINKLRRRF